MNTYWVYGIPPKKPLASVSADTADEALALYNSRREPGSEEAHHAVLNKEGPQ